MINGVELQYPNANQSVIQKAKYESKKFECIKQDSWVLLNRKGNKLLKFAKKFEKNLKLNEIL